MDPTQRLERLTDAQRDCLRLVYQHKSSKDIARQLGISPHTVDQRLRRAIHVLGASSRVEAALLLARHEGAAPYQRLAYQAPHLPAEPAASAESVPHAEGPARSGGVFREERAAFGAPPALGPPSGLPPVLRERGQVNGLTTLRRLGWMLAIAIGSALAFGAILSGLDALSRLS